MIVQIIANRMLKRNFILIIKKSNLLKGYLNSNRISSLKCSTAPSVKTVVSYKIDECVASL